MTHPTDTAHKPQHTESQQLWFSFVEGDTYTQPDPFFFDLSDTTWIAELEQNWTTIKQELSVLLAEQDTGIIPYINRTLANQATNWTVFVLFAWGITLRRNCRKCPVTTQLLQKIPNMVSASFSMMRPQTSIKPHLGDTNAMYRCHLGLQIPAGTPQCTMKVGNEERPWHEGKVLAFCDAQRHTAWNKTDQPRYVLIFDVIRPQFAHQTPWICAKVLGNLFWQTLFQKFYIIGHFPPFVRRMMMNITQYPARLAMWLYGRLS